MSGHGATQHRHMKSFLLKAQIKPNHTQMKINSAEHKQTRIKFFFFQNSENTPSLRHNIGQQKFIDLNCCRFVTTKPGRLDGYVGDHRRTEPLGSGFL